MYLQVHMQAHTVFFLSWLEKVYIDFHQVDIWLHG